MPEPPLGLDTPREPTEELTVVDCARVLALCREGVKPSLPCNEMSNFQLKNKAQVFQYWKVNSGAVKRNLFRASN